MAAQVFKSIFKAVKVIADKYPFMDFSGTIPAISANADLTCDESGSLWTRQAIEPEVNRAALTGYGASEILWAEPCLLNQLGGFNDSEVEAYIQVFDNAALPVNGDLPEMVFRVPAGGTFSWEPSLSGRFMRYGIVVVASSTPAVLTLLAADFWVYTELVKAPANTNYPPDS